jgi:hypothetical protein
MTKFDRIIASIFAAAILILPITVCIILGNN